MGHRIKGGGRVPFSDQVEEALTSVLLAIHQEKANATTQRNATEHDKKREHKRFVKRLQERQERQALETKLNPTSSPPDDQQSQSSSQVSKANSTQSAKVAEGTSRKVRIELVEAIFRGGGSSNNDDFKQGTKKTMVFASTTAVHDIMKEAKLKLRMKKSPVRCFVVDKKLAVDLMGDLRGLCDGAKVYVTASSQCNNQGTAQAASDKDDVDKGAGSSNGDEVDPLEAVKEAYRKRNRPRSVRTIPLEHPDFTGHFETLAPLSPERARLPAATCREAILTTLSTTRVLIVCGSTGCGKSTQVPQFVLEGMTAAGLRDSTSILVTQPRRVAATALAHRVASEMNTPEPTSKKGGSEVGYIVRMDRAVSDNAKIVYCTVGILLRMLVCPQEEEGGSDPGSADVAAVPLSSITHVVIDEVHERDVNTDFVLTLLRRLLNVNKQIRVILMSATASAQLFVRYFEEGLGIEPTVLDIPGRSFPVEIRWIGECEKFAGSGMNGISSPKKDESDMDSTVLSPRATAKIDNEFVKKLLVAIIRKQQSDGDLKVSGKDGPRHRGAVLVFLPGKGEIETLAKTLYADPIVGDRSLCNILKLHSTVPRGEQQAVFAPARVGTVKIVLATNIAETSITISDISEVIDCGRVKESRFNSSTRIKELVTVWTSQASAKQRAGRAGRTSAGTCWRLYSEGFSKEVMPQATSPEILRTPLDELVMQLSLLYENRKEGRKSAGQATSAATKGVCPLRFLGNTPDPPSDESTMEACNHLLEVGALRVVTVEPTILYRLTPLGYHLSRLPMDPKVGKVLLVGCMLGCMDNALTVAAALSNTKSCFPTRWNSVKEEEWQSGVLVARKALVEKGFGGSSWRGGTVKGDLTATIAVYREWKKRRNEKERKEFCTKHGLDNQALKEITVLRSQFCDLLQDAGFIGAENDSFCNEANDDALLTSCCLVAGLYPNVCTLMRPRKGGPKGGRLLTKNGDVCRPSKGSFQAERVRTVAESGKDAYAVFHAKHRSVGVGDNKVGDVFLSNVDFLPRFALLLFGGELMIDRNAMIVDSWLKFKIGEKSAGLVLIQELRFELNNLLLDHVKPGDKNLRQKENSDNLILVLRKLLTEEA